MLDKNKKITLATVKKFIKENINELYIENHSTFDGMIDGSIPCKSGFKNVITTDEQSEHRLGIKGAWFVGRSRDYFTYFKNNEFIGIEVYNSCDNFTIAIKNVKFN